MELFLFWILLCVIPAAIAQSKGRSGVGMFFLSFFLSPLVGLIVVLVMGKKESVIEERQIGTGNKKKCPYCAEVIKIEAVVCRYCGKDLP